MLFVIDTLFALVVILDYCFVVIVCHSLPYNIS